MEFLFPLIVVALGGTMFFFRWRARQRRRLYGSANADTGVMVGVSTAMTNDRDKGSDAVSRSELLAAGGATSLGDGYAGARNDGGGASGSVGSDGEDGGGGDGGGGDGGGGGGD
jgi:hypothetical protein